MANDEEIRKCPYCEEMLKHPYWQHIQSKHPGEYTKNETWIQLFRDYMSMGMDQSMSLMVISELFNQKIDDVKSYLRENKIL